MDIAIYWCAGVFIGSVIHGANRGEWSFEGFVICSGMTAWLYYVGALT